MPMYPSFCRYTSLLYSSSAPGSSKLSLSPRFEDQNPVSTTLLPIRATCPAHLIPLDSPCPCIQVSEDTPHYYTPHLRLGLPSCLFPPVFTIKILYTPLFSQYVLHAQPISFF
jgi:hypothetical protein